MQPPEHITMPARLPPSTPTPGTRAPSSSAEWGTFAPTRIQALYITATRRRLLSGWLRREISRLVLTPGRPLDVEIDGYNIRCYPFDNLSERQFLNRGNRYNQDGLRMIVDRLKPGDVFVDVGANFGQFAMYAANAVGPSGRVIAIEAAPVMGDRLSFNIELNAFQNIDVVRSAVSNSIGSLTIYVSSQQRGLSSAAAIDGGIATEVPATTLTEIARSSRLTRINALKIDIEGYEDRALLPILTEMPRSLWPRAVLMETSHRGRWERDCVEEMLAAGYTMNETTKADALLLLSEPP